MVVFFFFLVLGLILVWLLYWILHLCFQSNNCFMTTLIILANKLIKLGTVLN